MKQQESKCPKKFKKVVTWGDNEHNIVVGLILTGFLIVVLALNCISLYSHVDAVEGNKECATYVLNVLVLIVLGFMFLAYSQVALKSREVTWEAIE